MIRLLLAVFACALTASVPAGSPPRLYVDQDVSAPGDGSSWAEALETIGEAVAAAGAGTEIWVAEGRYQEAVTLRSGITLRGGFAGDESTLAERAEDTLTDIDVNALLGPVRPITGIDVSNVLVERFRLMNGHPASGGAVFNGGGAYLSNVPSTVVFERCIFLQNGATDGGGAFCTLGATPRFESCTFENNSATDDGGGVYFSAGSGGQIINATIRGNGAGDFGGGVYTSVDSPVTMNNVEVMENTAVNGGGGIAVRDSQATLEDVTLESNKLSGIEQARGGGNALVFEGSIFSMTGGVLGNGGDVRGNGGGLEALDSEIVLQDVNIIGNFASDMGGGIFVGDCTGRLSNVVLANNTALGGGGGGYFTGELPPIEGLVVHENFSLSNGVGTLFSGATGTVRGMILSMNETNTAGGSALLVAGGGSVTLDQSTIAGNINGLSGTLVVNDASLVVRNSLVVGNRAADSNAGSVTGANGVLAFENSTLSGNFGVPPQETNVHLRARNGATLSLRNTVLEGNGEAAIALDEDAVFESRNSLFFGPASILGAIGTTAQMGEDPRFLNSLVENPRFLASQKNNSEAVIQTDFSDGGFSLNEETATSEFSHPDLELEPGSLTGRLLWISSLNSVWAILGNSEDRIVVAGLVRDSIPSEAIVAVLDYGLALNSLGIDAGDAAGLSFSEDRAGKPRIVDVAGLAGAGDNAIDMGAYELQQTSVPGGVPEVVYVRREPALRADGRSWLTAYTDIQDAIDDARSATRPIWIEEGDFFQAIALENNRRLIGGLRVGDLAPPAEGAEPLTQLINPGPGKGTPPPPHLVEIVGDSNVILENLLLTGGEADGFSTEETKGGAVYIVDSAPVTIRHSTIRESSAVFGGGVSIRDSNVLFDTVTLFGNTAENLGGALFLEGDSSVELQSSTIIGSQAGNSGGGIYLQDSSSLAIRETVLEALTSNGVGGALFQAGGTTTITDSSVRQGTAEVAGGLIAIDGGEATIERTILENATVLSLSGRGGIFAVEDASLTIRNSEAFFGNSERGGAIDAVRSEVTLDNVVIRRTFSPLGALAFQESDVTIDESDFVHNVGVLIASTGSEVLVRRTLMSSSTSAGIPDEGLLQFFGGLSSLTNVILTANSLSFSNLVLYDGGLHFLTHSTVANNSIPSNTNTGMINVQNGADARIRNNIFHSYDDTMINRGSTTDPIVIEHNLFSLCDTPYRENEDGTRYSDVASLNDLGFATGNVDGDATFLHSSDFAVGGHLSSQGGGIYQFDPNERETDIASLAGRMLALSSFASQAYVVSVDGDLLEIDPGFAIQQDSVVVVDYRPLIDSPAIDAAFAPSTSMEDFGGRARPREIPGVGDSTGYDIGAWEFYPAELSATPDPLDFGDVAVSRTRDLRLSNLGDLPLSFVGNRAAIVADASDSFSLVGNAPEDLVPGAGATIGVRFAPTTDGPQTAILLLTTNDPGQPNYEVALSGNGTFLADTLAALIEDLLDITAASAPDANGDNLVDAADLVAVAAR